MKNIGAIVCVLALFLPMASFAATLININTADETLLETLPDVGPVIAGRIITYRETNGPFATIEDLQNVKGIGSGVTYAKIAPLITVGTSGTTTTTPPVTTATSSSPTASSDATTTAVTNTGGGGTPEYLPIPVLRLVVGGSRTVAVGADTAFSAVVYDAQARKRNDAFISWSFGDGMSRTGASVLHAFYEPGEYLVSVEASTDDGGLVTATFIVHAKKVGVTITGISPKSIALTNDDASEADISYWRLVAGLDEFKFPPHTKILPKHTVIFSSHVTNLVPVGLAVLKLPSGEVAAVYPPAEEPLKTQPPPAPTSYNSVQKVEPKKSNVSQPAYDVETVVAPTASTSVAAVGAALSPAPSSSPTTLLTSPWLYGFAGVLAFSAAALLFI